MWHSILVLMVLAGVCPMVLGQEPTPVGGEFQVNSFTTGYQLEPATVVKPDGSFVVVWFGSDGLDGDGFGVFGQLFAADGSRQGDEFQVNTNWTGHQALPEIAADDAGNFVVVWQSAHSDLDIAAQRFTAAGDPVGGELAVNSITADTQAGPDVAMAGDGDFVVVWHSALGADIFEIAGRRFAADGTPRGAEFQVNTYTTGAQLYAAVAMDGQEDFVVVWVDGQTGINGQDGDQEGVFGRRFAADGMPEGGELQVNSYATGRQYSPVVARAPSGEFIAVWHGDSLGGNLQDIMGRRFTAQGVPIGEEFRINDFTLGSQIHPAVVAFGAGELAVAWSSPFLGGGTRGIAGQLLAADGTPNGGEFLISSYTTGFQDAASLSVSGKSLVVTWDSDESSGPDTSLSIQGQRFELQQIFADGFESGDVSAWSSTTP